MSAESVLLRQDGIVRAGVACIVRRWSEEDMATQTLMIRRKGSHGAGTWSVPGGWIEYGESMRQAACRELAEEVNIHIPSPGDLRYHSFTEDLFNDDGKHAITFWFYATVPSDTVPVNGEPTKITDIMWVEVGCRRILPKPLFLPLRNFLADDLNTV